MMIPPLIQGDKVGIISTARSITKQEIEIALWTIESNGYIPVIGKSIGKQFTVFAGDDNFRATELQQFLDDSDIKAILFARGGYGTIRILDKIDFSSLLRKPKWLCGFSDVTILHVHVNDKLGLPTIHSAMPFNFQDTEPETIRSLFHILKGEKPEYVFAANQFNKPGIAEGELIGGNLSIIYSLLGTRFGFNSTGKILFLEEVDEYLYHIDRMMMSLKLAGKLNHLKGIVIGGFTQIKDNAVPFGKSIFDIILDHTSEFDIPVCFNFPAGHIKLNKAFYLGKKVTLQVSESGCKLEYL